MHGQSVGDEVDRVVAGWARERPELPVAPIEIIMRLNRVRARFDEELAGVFARFDLSPADFAVIAVLRRQGAPFTCSQSALMARLALTSGTVSVRLARLEKKGIVERRPGEDRRGVLVTLTERGARLFDEVAPEHLANEDVLLSSLTDAERGQLASLLRKLLVAFEHEHVDLPIGVTVLPAHAARRARTSVGLSDRAGLLVHRVAPGSPAHAAGVQAGDLVVGVADRPLRSAVDLVEAIASADGEPVRLELLRGETERSVILGQTS